MIKDQLGFIAKVLIASWVLSVMIKQSDKFLVLAPSNFNALVIVLLPAFLMFLFLGWQYWRDKNKDQAEV